MSWRRVNFQAVLVSGYVCGLASSLVVNAWMPVVPALLFAATGFAAAWAWREKPLGLVAAALAGFILSGMVVGCLRLASLGDSDLVPLAGKRVALELVAIKAPRERNGKVTFFAAAERGEYRGQGFEVEETVLVELYCREGCSMAAGVDIDPRGVLAGGGREAAAAAGERCPGDRCPAPDAAAISEGMRFRIEGVLSTPEPTPGADFDYGEYLARRGLHTVITAGPGSVELLPPREGAAGTVDTLRRHARASLAAGEWGAATGLFKGMVIGDVSDVPDGVSDDMRDAGLLHLLAVSGQNVVLLGFVITLICRGLGFGRITAVAVTMAVIAAYIPLAGADASIVRAGCVGMLGLGAFLMGRRAARYYLLCLSAAVLLSLNPNSLLDPGFQLSYAAVLGIFYLVPALMLLLRPLPGILAEAVAVSAAAGLATAPVTLAHFQQVSLVTVPANVMAAPVAGPVMLLGVLSVIAAPFSYTVSWLLNALAATCTAYLLQVARHFASLPWAVYTAPVPDFLMLSWFYAMLAGMAICVHRIAAAGLYGSIRRLWKWAAAALAVLVLAAFSCYGAGTAPPPSSYTVSFLDVGQGDAILFQVPGGATVLVDGGPGSAVIDRLKQSGVERIDAVFVSHSHADHIAGLLPVLERYDVGAVYDSGAPSSSPVYGDLLRVVERKGIEYRAVRAGDSLAFGDLEIEVLAPGLDLVPDDANANSLVLVAGYGGLDVLLPGDAEGDRLGSLDLPAVEVLKVSHHGSSDGGLARLLDRIEPEAAVISVGAGNEYGHPHASALDALRASGADLFRTDRDGTVRVALVNGEMVVSASR